MAEKIQDMAKSVDKVDKDVGKVSESVEKVADDVKEVAEDVEDVAEGVANTTRILNDFIKKHYGEPVFASWFQKLDDIVWGRVPPDSEFLFPSNLAEWLQPQYGMCLIVWFCTKLWDYGDARWGSRVCKKHNLRQHPILKVSHSNFSDKILVFYSFLFFKKVLANLRARSISQFILGCVNIFFFSGTILKRKPFHSGILLSFFSNRRDLLAPLPNRD